MFTKYSIGESDTFNALQYPAISIEIDRLQKRLVAFDGAHKAEIIISLLKDHSIKTEWLSDNKLLAKLFASGSLATSHIESLFNSCRHNTKFTAGFEKHIAVHFLPSSV